MRIMRNAEAWGVIEKRYTCSLRSLSAAFDKKGRLHK